MVDKRTSRTVANGYANLFAATSLGVGAIIQIILVFSLACLHLLDGGCPQIAIGPWYLSVLGVEHLALVAPLLKVSR